MTDINKYLAIFTDYISIRKIGDTESNNLLLQIMPNGWSRQEHVKIFYFEIIYFKQESNMFERI